MVERWMDEWIFVLFPLGALNFTIGQDVIDGFGENEFARIREEAEFSAVYLIPNPPDNTEESTDNQGNLLRGSDNKTIRIWELQFAYICHLLTNRQRKQNGSKFKFL